MYLVVLYLPIINFLIISFCGRFIGHKGSYWLATINIFFVTIISYMIFFEVVINGSICFFSIFTWIDINLLNVNWGFLFDPIASTMLLVVSTISLLVHFYSIGYMYNDPFTARFIAYLSLFTWFMLILVTSDNLLQLFLGWEGVGIVSYLLINFWFTILSANQAAMKAVIMNRIGDLGLVFSIGLIYLEFKTLNFSTIFAICNVYQFDYIYFFHNYIHLITLITIFMFVGVMGKSAQFGLHTWLPDAMAGPTPVSALIHAATMVTAGVFLLIRLSPLIEYSYKGLYIITFIGILTAFFSATVGLFQNDLKKIIAYSTCSQLGYMVFICGLSNYSVGLFHLVNHAFFKALLFLSAGSIIHSLSDEQDIRKYGGLIKLLPFSYIAIVVGSLALMGVPFLTGFYSKDFIMEIAYNSYLVNNSFFYWLSVVTAFFTTLYSIKLLFFVFLSKPGGYKRYFKVIHESNFFISFPLFILILYSIFFGYLNRDLFIGLGSDTWLNWISITSTKNLLVFESEFLAAYIKNIPLFFSILGICIILMFYYSYLFFYNRILKKNNYLWFKKLLNVYNFFSYKWYIDIFYLKVIVVSFFKISFNFFKNIDRGFFELIGPLGLVRFINISSYHYKLVFMNNSYIFNYLFIMISSIIIFIIINFCFLFINSEIYFIIIVLLYFSNFFLK